MADYDIKGWPKKLYKRVRRKGRVFTFHVTAINICNENENHFDILVEGNRSMQVEKLLRDREIPYEVVASDMCPLYLPRPRSPKRNNLAAPVPKAWKSGKDRYLDWKDFYSLNVIYNWMHEIERLFPATCTVCVIGKSVEGRYIKMLKISNSDASNTGVWLDGCIHAREWISVSVVTYIADYIARNFDKLPTYMTNKDWYFVPVVNPDGYHYTHVSDRMWRKSRSRVGNTIVGVDLNRNFGHNWGLMPAEGVSLSDPNHQNFRGSEPFSEPETSAVKDSILYSGIPFKIFITFHSCSEVISFPWCHTSEPCPDYVNLLEGGAVMAKAIYDTTGRLYKVGNFKDIMYFASGTSIDWSYGTAKIPFTYLVELRSKQHRFQLPKDEIFDCCREALAGVSALAEFVEKKKCLNVTIYESKMRNI